MDSSKGSGTERSDESEVGKIISRASFSGDGRSLRRCGGKYARANSRSGKGSSDSSRRSGELLNWYKLSGVKGGRLRKISNV